MNSNSVCAHSQYLWVLVENMDIVNEVEKYLILTLRRVNAISFVQ